MVARVRMAWPLILAENSMSLTTLQLDQEREAHGRDYIVIWQATAKQLLAAYKRQPDYNADVVRLQSVRLS